MDVKFGNHAGTLIDHPTTIALRAADPKAPKFKDILPPGHPELHEPIKTALANGPLTAKQLAAKVGEPEIVIRNALTYLVRDGHVTEIKRIFGGNQFQLDHSIPGMKLVKSDKFRLFITRA